MDKGVVWECCGTSQTLIEDVEAYNTTLCFMRFPGYLYMRTNVLSYTSTVDRLCNNFQGVFPFPYMYPQRIRLLFGALGYS